MTAPPVFDPNGIRISLGRRLGQGGEGSVFEVAGDSTRVAKVYTAPAPSEKAEKLRVMAAVASPSLVATAAWPSMTLHSHDGRVLGFLMRRLARIRELHQLYNPSQRKQDFPRADWRFLVHAGRNLAAAVGNVHAHGHVIGDLNQKNVAVADDATITLIDCDSFQISSGGRRFLCEVGVDHFTPPELQGQSFAGVVRSPNHDAFGLAVLIFHLLFLGRHPFAGRYSGQGDMPIPRAIKEFRFAFGANAPAQQMLPPPNVLPLMGASVIVAELFERAFSPGGVRSTGRPNPPEWVQALAALEATLAKCQNDRLHMYHWNGAGCPWCAIEQAGGPTYFVDFNAVAARLTGQTGPGAFQLDRLWNDIRSISLPPARSTGSFLPAGLSITPAYASSQRSKIARAAGWIATASAVLGLIASSGVLFGIALACLATWALIQKAVPLMEARSPKKRAYHEAASLFEGVRIRWEQADRESRDIFGRKFRELEGLRSQYLGLATERDRQRAALEGRKRDLQLRHFLEQQSIYHAPLPGIGSGLKATLAAYGIDTAADIESARVHNVPGFGPARVATLLAWRRLIEGRFVFDKTKSIDPNDYAMIDRQIIQKRATLESALAQGAATLRELHDSALRKRRGLETELSQAARQLVDAQPRA